MHCEKIREYLLTDYADLEGPAEVRDRVRAHLETCPGCREYAAELERTVLSALRNSSRAEPDGSVWLKIRDRLRDEKKPARNFGRDLGRFLPRWTPVRFSFALSGVAALLIFVAVGVRFLPYWDGTVQKQALGAYLAGAFEGDATLQDEWDFGTAIEDVFL